jgi:hypothetical protein
MTFSQRRESEETRSRNTVAEPGMASIPSLNNTRFNMRLSRSKRWKR